MRKMPGAEFDNLVDFFDRMAQTDWLSAVHHELIGQMGDWKGKKVLDVGCGPGRLLIGGGTDAASICGIDLSEQMIVKAKENAEQAGLSARSSFQVGDAYTLPFKDGHFDLSLSTCVMFLLPEPEKGMAELLRVTKKGGRVAMLNPSEKMNETAVTQYIEEQGMDGFEKDTLAQWAKVSTRRHRYSETGLTEQLMELGAEEVSHHPVLDGLALATIAHI